MSERPTPETDALDPKILYCVPITDHARNMERQRDYFRASIEQQANQVMAKAAKMAEDAIRERDEAREALLEFVNAVGKPGRSEWLNDEGYAGAMSAWERARAILEAKP